MRHGILTEIAECAGVTTSFISAILKGKNRPSWKIANKISACTGTWPELWLEGSAQQMQQAIGGLTIIDGADDADADKNVNPIEELVVLRTDIRAIRDRVVESIDEALDRINRILPAESHTRYSKQKNYSKDDWSNFLES